MEDTFNSFIALIDLDTEVVTAQSFLTKYAHDLQTVDYQQAELQNQIQQAQHEITMLNKQVITLTDDVTQLDERLFTLTQRRMQVHNERQLQSVEQEITQLNTLRSTMEDALLAALDQQTDQTKKCNARIKELKHQAQELATHQDKLIQMRNDLEERITHHATQRPGLVAHVDPALYKTYEQMRAKIANPVVPCVNGICKGCNNHLSKSDMLHLEQKKLITCTFCYRLVYYAA